ncbi:phosphohistidine phosphatase SixA [Aquabacterium sp. J223]|uniref:phosphohistidine phosphatase SixA n=1 Tax=Aquabacterium sp. J223 TaxID=2898431 RepID=UPI0021ADFFC9|nr:phosphohistidine phosphatase SixA [Aquabacterium sp. J223]UUX94083.1 phosphohistidine phosphatase SixA [Aquabacterium sp. J223]
MDLILWRHAEAFDAVEGQDDLERALTPKGERQAARMAQWLNQALPATTRVLVSPARRAQQTVQPLERRFKTVPAVAPGGTVEALLAAARWPESREPVLVVGHQPTLGLAAAYLLAGVALSAEEPWRIKKGGLWWLRHQAREDAPARLTLVTVRSPDLL